MEVVGWLALGHASDEDEHEMDGPEVAPLGRYIDVPVIHPSQYNNHPGYSKSSPCSPLHAMFSGSMSPTTRFSNRDRTVINSKTESFTTKMPHDQDALLSRELSSNISIDCPATASPKSSYALVKGLLCRSVELGRFSFSTGIDANYTILYAT